MSPVPALPFSRSESDRVVAGVCGGIAVALGVDATLVRLVFAFLALAGGAGILLYLALWVWTSGRRPVLGVVLVALAAMTILFALGLSGATVLGIGLIVAGSCCSPAAAHAAAGRHVHRPRHRTYDRRRGDHARPARLVAARSSRPARSPARSAPAPPVDMAGGVGAGRADPPRRARRGRRANPRLGAPDARTDPARGRRRAACRARSPAGRSATCAAGSTAADTAARPRSRARSPTQPPTSRTPRRPHRARERGRCAARRAAVAARPRRARGHDERREARGRRRGRRLHRRRPGGVSVFVRDRGAGFDRAAVAPTAAASPSRSRRGCSAPAGARSSRRRPARAPRSN